MREIKKIEKPGKKPKGKIKNKPVRLHDMNLPDRMHCRKCGRETGTESLRHAESRIIKFLDGGGCVGSKINDNLTSLLCIDCDRIMSTPLPKNCTDLESKEFALEWSLLIIKTHLI